MSTAQQACLARLHVHDIGAQVTYLGLIEDLLGAGLISASMVPALGEGRASYRRGRRCEKVKLFEADTLTIERKGPLLEVSFWGETHGTPAVVRSHAEPWDKVLTLPTAAAAPVVNPRRRGRYPRGVTPITAASCARFQREQRQRLTSAKKTALRGFEEHADMCRVEIAQLEQLQKGGCHA
jgi:hypothetical protein